MYPVRGSREIKHEGQDNNELTEVKAFGNEGVSFVLYYKCYTGKNKLGRIEYRLIIITLEPGKEHEKETIDYYNIDESPVYQVSFTHQDIIPEVLLPRHFNFQEVIQCGKKLHMHLMVISTSSGDKCKYCQ
jgi:hypothetical protein